MADKKKQKEMLTYYVCGKLPWGKLDKEVKSFIKDTPEIDDFKEKIIESLSYIELSAAKGQVNLMGAPLIEINTLLEQYGLSFPAELRDNLMKIGLMNGVPMEFQQLSEALENRNAMAIAKHWKFFSNYVNTLESLFTEEELTKGAKKVLERWRKEYEIMEEIISDPFHINR